MNYELKTRVCVASSWRNGYQQGVVKALRSLGFHVYDFRNPAPGDHGFAWSEIDPEWKRWDQHLFRRALNDPIAGSRFAKDSRAVDRCDFGVLVLPCGRSAHLEAGVIVGSGKPLLIYMPEPCEPELMYSWARKICADMDELVFATVDLGKELAA